jgi:hypothetical protein
MDTYIKNLISGLKGKGYFPITEPNDKEQIKQVLIEFDSADIEKETQATYRYAPTISMTTEVQIEDMDAVIKELIGIAEVAVTTTMRDFQINKIDMDKFGTTHMLKISGSYIEIINTGVA